MKYIKKAVVGILAGVFLISAVGCNMIEKTPEAIAKTVVAKVGDRKITRGQLDSSPEIAGLIKTVKEQYGENYAQSSEVKDALKQQKLQVLNQMIVEEAIIQEAEKLKVVPSEEEMTKQVNKELDDFRKMQNLKDDKKFQETLKNEGITEETLKSMIKKRIIIEKFRDKVVKDVKVEDKEIKDNYNKYKDKYPKDIKNPTKLHLAHILVSDKAKAEDIKKQLDKGANFAELAKKYGTDGTKDIGGDLGVVPTVNSNFDQDFMNGAMQLKQGEISGPVQSKNGYHIIKCIKREDKPLKSFEEAKGEIKNSILQEKQNSVLMKKINEVKAKSKVKIYEDKLI